MKLRIAIGPVGHGRDHRGVLIAGSIAAAASVAAQRAGGEPERRRE